MELVTTAPAAGEGALQLLSTGKPVVKPASVASQTAAIGVITPPPDIRSIVDKTAQFVARNGVEFERRILANEKNNAKFNFLTPGDPYHAYYQHKVSSFRLEDAGAKPAGEPSAANEAPAKVAVQLATNFKPIVLEAPEKEQFSIPLPDGITAFDLDVVRLTAQFVARNGKSFLTGLTSREHTNAQFNFLKPAHSMFTFFTSLADSYSKILMPTKHMRDRLARDADKAVVLDRCLKRLEWERSQERARREEEDKEEAEREAMAAVDWHDFVVVETIDFYSEEDGGLPLPLALPEVIAQLRAARMEEPLSVQAEEAEMEVEMDEEERELVRPAQTQLLPAGPPPEAPEPQMKIVRNYKRAGVVAGGTSGAAQHVVSPITGELVPVDQMAEHMRISLIDPKWKVEREAMLGKLRGSTVASDEEIARNVVGLARTRPDIFSSSAADVSVAFSAEMERQKRAAEERPAGPLSRASGQEVQQPTAPFVHVMQRPPMPLAPSMSWPPMHAPPGFPGGMPPPAFLQHMYPHGLPPGLPPPMGMYGMPPPLVHPPGMPLQHAPLQPPAGVAGDEPGAKRQRVEEALIPEEDFAEAHPEPFSIDVAVPEVEGDSSLRGQTVQLEVGAMETIGDVKARLAMAVGVAASKQKMMHGAAFLKDTSTLAAYNFGPHTALTMALKARGKKGG